MPCCCALPEREGLAGGTSGWAAVRAHTCACGLSLTGVAATFLCKALWVQRPELGASQRSRRDPQLNPGILPTARPGGGGPLVPGSVGGPGGARSQGSARGGQKGSGLRGAEDPAVGAASIGL